MAVPSVSKTTPKTTEEKKESVEKKVVDETVVLDRIRDPNAAGAETLRPCLGP